MTEDAVDRAWSAWARNRREKLIANIDASRKARLPRILNGLGIPFVGERTAQFLAEEFGDLDKIAAATEEELQQAEEVGPKVAQSIRRFFDEERNRELVERLREEGFSFHLRDQAKDRRPAREADVSCSPARFPI